MLGVPSRVMPMKATLAPPKDAHLVGREDGLAVILADHIGSQELEVGAGEVIAIQAAVHRVAAALLHAHQLAPAFVELVVADGVEIQADQVEGLDGRLIVEQGRKQRAGADHIAGGDHHRVRVERAQVVDVGGQVLHTAGVDRADPPGGAGGRLQVAVKIV